MPFAIIKTSLSLQVETLGGEYASFDEARSVLFGTCWNICHDHSFNWVSNLIVTLTFLALVQMTGASRTFWLYGLFAIGAWIFSYRLAPATFRAAASKRSKSFGATKLLFISRHPAYMKSCNPLESCLYCPFHLNEESYGYGGKDSSAKRKTGSENAARRTLQVGQKGWNMILPAPESQEIRQRLYAQSGVNPEHISSKQPASCFALNNGSGNSPYHGGAPTQGYEINVLWASGMEEIKSALARQSVAACFCGFWLVDGTYRDVVRHSETPARCGIPVVIVCAPTCPHEYRDYLAALKASALSISFATRIDASPIWREYFTPRFRWATGKLRSRHQR